LRSGLLGNPIGGLHFWNCGFHLLHPWHKCLDLFSPKSNIPIFWVILDLKIKSKKTLVKDYLFWISLAYLQSSWDFQGPNRSSLWSLVHILLPQYQRIWFHVGHSNSHGSFFFHGGIFLLSWLVLV